MSVNYIDKSTGDLIRVAWQGKAEYGTSTERKGDITIPATTAGGLYLGTNGDLRAYVTPSENNEVLRMNFIYMKNL